LVDGSRYPFNIFRRSTRRASGKFNRLGDKLHPEGF
jgi:hypothetical protein